MAIQVLAVQEEREMKLGEEIRDRRLALKFTLTEVAMELGLSKAYWSDVENGRRIPTVGTLKKFCGTFGSSSFLSRWRDIRVSELIAAYEKRIDR